MTPSALPTFTVYSQRSDQFAGRLKGTLTVWRFARQAGRKTRIFWPARVEGYPISPLLDLEAMASLPASSDISFCEDAYSPIEGVTNMPQVPGWPNALQRDTVASLQGDLLANGEKWILFEGETYQDAKKGYRELFQLLLPRPEIAAFLPQALEWIGAPGYVAVHIRRGDIIKSLREIFQGYNTYLAKGRFERAVQVEKRMDQWTRFFVERTASLQSYATALRAPEYAGKKLVLFGDSPEVCAELKHLLPDRKTVQISDFKTDSLTVLQRAFFEFLLLTRASRIVSTGGSNFGKMASICGGTRLIDVRPFGGAAETRLLFEELFKEFFTVNPSTKTVAYALLECYILKNKLT